MTLGNTPPPPIINKQKPTQKPHQQMPTQTAWIATFKRLFSIPNTRYAFLWLTGGLLFALFGKKAIAKREQELMVEDIENYLENKNKKNDNGFE